MQDIESILVLLLAAALLVRVADYGKIPAPIVLVLYRSGVGGALAGAFSFGAGALEFVGVAAGGIVAGLAAAWISDLVLRRQHESGLSIMLSVLTAYGAYIGAEELHVSGILAAVV